MLARAVDENRRWQLAGIDELADGLVLQVQMDVPQPEPWCPLTPVGSGTLYFDADVFGLITLTSLESTTRELERLGIVPPFVIGVSLVSAAGSVLSTRINGGQPILELQPREFDRNELLAPDVLMVDGSHSLEGVMRPAFEAIWQGAGWHRCVHYDESGNLPNSGAFFSA